jgi:hypothetical protein
MVEGFSDAARPPPPLGFAERFPSPSPRDREELR